jgi:hypothetical protein
MRPGMQLEQPALAHAYFFAFSAAARSRNAAMVAAAGSLRLLFFGRRFLLVL